jgi:RNA-directed DNA polymerase
LKQAAWRAFSTSFVGSWCSGAIDQGPRKVGIPKEAGKVRQLSIPSIRDRVVQGALKLILEPIFEADFQSGSYGYRPKKSAQAAVQRVSDAILEGKTYVIDLDLRSYFDTVRHHIVLEKVARRVCDDRIYRTTRSCTASRQGLWAAPSGSGGRAVSRQPGSH